MYIPFYATAAEMTFHLLQDFDKTPRNRRDLLCVNGLSMRWWILSLLWLTALSAQQQQSQPAAPAANASGFVGSAVCKTCHPDVWLNFYKNPHYKSIASGTEPPERTGCEGCHGPGKAHVEARGGKSTIPHAFSLMDTKAVLEDCLGCHARD